MMLNRLPVLDKGYVALLSVSCNFDKCNEIALEFFKRSDSSFLKEFSTLTLVVKCPLFIQLNLSTFNLRLMSIPQEEVEAYVPNVGRDRVTGLEEQQGHTEQHESHDRCPTYQS
jgi:hypothetical protein